MDVYGFFMLGKGTPWLREQQPPTAMESSYAKVEKLQYSGTCRKQKEAGFLHG